MTTEQAGLQKTFTKAQTPLSGFQMFASTSAVLSLSSSLAMSIIKGEPKIQTYV
jgi:hypothetical protein